MTKTQQKLLQELRNIATGPVALDFANVDVDAIKLVFAEIERLTTENADLKRKVKFESTNQLTQVIAKLAIANVGNLAEIRRLKSKANHLITARLIPGSLIDDDLTREVIE
jgi:hypothetical protein